MYYILTQEVTKKIKYYNFLVASDTHWIRVFAHP